MLIQTTNTRSIEKGKRKMKKEFLKGITEIVSTYVDEVAKEMLFEAKLLSKSDWFVDMVESFYERFQEEQTDYETEVEYYLTSGTEKELNLKPSCLTHSKAYRQVIVDILQNKLNK